MTVRIKFKVHNFTHSWDNRGTSKIWAVPAYARTPFSQKFLKILFGWTFWMYRPNLKFVLLSVREIIAIRVLGGVANPNLGEEEAVGGLGWFRWKERWWVRIGPPICLRISEILPLLCSRMPLFPTPLLVSPKFLHVPLGGWDCWEWMVFGLRRVKVLGLLSVQLVSKISMWSWSTNGTDGRIDRHN